MGNPNVTEYAGELPDGRPFTHIVRRRCRCLACDQARFDVSHENRVASK